MVGITRDHVDRPRHRPAAGLEGSDRRSAVARSDSPDLDRRLRAARTWLRKQFNMVPIPALNPPSRSPGRTRPDLRLGGRRDAATAMGCYELGRIRRSYPGAHKGLRWNGTCAVGHRSCTYDFRREDG